MGKNEKKDDCILNRSISEADFGNIFQSPVSHGNANIQKTRHRKMLSGNICFLKVRVHFEFQSICLCIEYPCRYEGHHISHHGTRTFKFAFLT